MRTIKKPNQNGFILVEALVALIVVAVGILGIGKMNALLLQGTGVSKTRAEAIQLAQDRVETARNFNLQAGCTDANLANASTNVTGVNANFTVATSYPASDTTWKAIEVCVTWDGGACNAVGNRVVLRSVISCAGMGTSAQVGTGSASGTRGGFIKTPTGRGTVGGGSYTPGSVPGTANNIDGINVPDNTSTYVRDDGVRELIDTVTGKVLLTVGKLGCENEAPQFSTISGKVYVEAKNGDPIVTESNLYVLSSDASYCTKLPYQNDWVLPSGSSGNNIKYFYTYYQCYIGAEWWGNIGLVRIDNANANNRVCVGSPVNSNTSTLFSKHSQLSTNRAYRGYREIGNNTGIYETKGIGESNTLNTACTAAEKKDVYTYTPQFLKNHHFVHTVITGQASDAACNTAQTTLNAYVPTGSLGSTTGNPTVTAPNDGSSKTITANNNPGKFYCMSNDDGVTCPNVTTNPTIPSTLVHGTITNYTGSATALTAIDSGGSSCNTEALTANGTTSYTYSCSINWSGFIGSSWNGAIAFTAGNGITLCPGSTAPTVVPTGNNVAYAINASNASSSPNSINFTDIPNAVTDITLNFDVKSGTCGALGQPNLSAWTFSGSGTNAAAASMSWATISGATSYRIRTCDITGQNTSCNPASSTPTTQTLTTFSTSASKSMCVMVTAYDGTTEGTSSTKCVKYTGGSTKAYSNF